MLLCHALVDYLEAHGGTVLTNSTVSQFLDDSNKTAQGIRLEDATEIQSRKAEVTSLDPQQTFLRLVDEQHLTGDFLHNVRNLSFGTASLCRVHYALNEALHTLNGAH